MKHAGPYIDLNMSRIHDGATEVPAAFRLGEWSVDQMLNRVSRDGRSIQLRPRAMDVLTVLAAAAGRRGWRRHRLVAGRGRRRTALVRGRELGFAARGFGCAGDVGRGRRCGVGSSACMASCHSGRR